MKNTDKITKIIALCMHSTYVKIKVVWSFCQNENGTPVSAYSADLGGVSEIDFDK
jgi:hypothetical protein